MDSFPKKPFTIAIIGGGIGGLSLAIGCLHHGVPVHIYEAAPAFGEIGAGVSFGPNAVAALRRVDPRIAEGFTRQATINADDDKKETWFDFRWGQTSTACQTEGELICEVKAVPTGQSSVHRAHFLEELVRLIPPDVTTFGKRVVDVKEQGPGEGEGVVLHFHDGTTAHADAAVGCDGVRSSIRQVLWGTTVEPTFSGKYCYRGLIPMDKAAAALGDRYARNSQLYVGRHGHVLTFPIERGKTMNVVAFRSRSEWTEKQWVSQTTKEEMLRDFEGWGEKVRSIITMMEKPDVWALFDHPPAEAYYRGKICMLGDAAHATTPHSGAGAGQAVEDAFVLSNLLGAVSEPSQLESVFAAFDKIRRPRSQNLVKASREAGMLYDCEVEGVFDDLDKMRENLATRYNWLWHIDIDQHLQETMAELRQRLDGHIGAKI